MGSTEAKLERDGLANEVSALRAKVAELQAAAAAAAGKDNGGGGGENNADDLEVLKEEIESLVRCPARAFIAISNCFI